MRDLCHAAWPYAGGPEEVRVAGVGFYVFLGLSAAAGGTVHGFCPGDAARACDLLWRFTLLMIGLAACSTWVLGVGVITSGRAVRGVGVGGDSTMCAV